MLIILAVTVLDQASKYIIKANIDYGDKIHVIDNFFYLTYHGNTGAAWGILQDGRLILIPLTIITSAVLFYILFKTDSRVLKVSLSFILGGAIGNLIDRAFIGAVTDFLEFHFGSYVFPTFNIADSFIVVGTGLLAYYMLFINKDFGQSKTDGNENSNN